MKLASYNHNGRASWGVVIGDARIVDVRPRLPRYHTLLDILRADALDEVRETIIDVRPDFKVGEVELLPPVVAPEKILCIGVNYANRNEEYKDQSELPKYPSMFFRTPGSFVGHGRNLIRPPESEQLDYEGEIVLIIGKECHRISRRAGARTHRWLHALQRRHHPRLVAACEVQRHAGQEFRSLRLDRSLDGDGRRDRIRQADAPDHPGQRRNPAGRHHREPDFRFRLHCFPTSPSSPR